MMKKIALGALLVAMGLSAMGCHAQVKVQAKTEAPPPKKAEPPPPAPAPPPPEEPKAGEQISLPDQIEFETNQAKIKQTPKTLETLEKLADLMKKHPHITKLRIEGHTDNVGSNKRNDKLSKQRADAVAKWLGQHEVETQRMMTQGFGANRPLKPNDSEENRAQNRRTEYYVEEVDGKKVEGDGKTVESKPDAKPADGKKVASGTPTSGKSTN